MPTGDTATSNRVLLVEGPSDAGVVGALRNKFVDPESFKILSQGGFSKLLKSIGPEVKAPDRQAVGILADANSRPETRWQDIRKFLSDLSLSVELPDEPDAGGTIIDANPRIGVWLMPGNTNGTDGTELEDFVLAMIPNQDPILPQAWRYIEGIDMRDREFKADKQHHAVLHAWLATREDPGLMGAAIQAGYLKTDGDLCQAFVAWLRKLFA